MSNDTFKFSLGLDGIAHGINVSEGMPQKCPKCGAGPEKWEIRNYDLAMHDGDIHCSVCGAYIRMYDAG